jgi:hypothetical protein
MVATLPVQNGVDDRSFPANNDLRKRCPQERWRVAAVAAGCNQARSRSAPSAINCCRSNPLSGGARCARRNCDSSNSLMVPFTPSSSRSLG